MFPDYIQRRLCEPPHPVGSRHSDILQLSLWMVAEGIPDSEILRICKDRYPVKSEKEISDLIRGAHSRNPQPVMRRLQLGSLSQTPIPKSETATTDFLRSAFSCGDIICITSRYIEEDGKRKPASSGIFRTREEWITHLAEHPQELEQDTWIRINPFSPGSSHGSDAEVSDYRHLLVEFDHLPKQQQWDVLRGSGLPLACIIDSGDRSLHGWVKLNAKSLEEFKERQKEVYEFLGNYIDDRSNINPSRYSRLPGAKRGKSRQHVISLGIGAVDYHRWHASLDLPRRIQIKDLLSYNKDNDPKCLVGNNWITKGSSLLIAGPSGIGKSSLVTQLAITWSLQKDFFGLKPAMPIRTVIVQAENTDSDLAEPLQDMIGAMKLTAEEIETIHDRVTFYNESGRTGMQFAGLLRRIVEYHSPDLLVCDPLLSYIGGDISSQQVASEFLRTQLQPIITESGIVLAFVHHTGKPNYTPAAQRNQEMDTKYNFLGSVELLNWAREIITIKDLSAGVFELSLGKRWRRACLLENGELTKKIRLEHDDYGILWREFKPREL